MARITLAGAVVLTLSVAPLLAHHSVAAEYDKSKTVTIQGTINKVEWMNPHAHVWVETNNGDTASSTWELELPAPSALMRGELSGEPNNGRDVFKPGDRVTVTLWRAKDGSLLGHALAVAFANGRVVNFPRAWPA